MSGNWRIDRLPELVRALAGRPRHEALRGHLIELLRSGFNAPYSEITHELYLLDGSGRIDAMWGATVIELKSDLRREMGDVLARLPDYLRDAAARARSPRPVVGIATDGAQFVAFEIRNDILHKIAEHTTNAERPNELMAWLELVISDKPDLLPEPRAIVQAFGRNSMTFGRARLALQGIWAAIGSDPEVQLKRDLWNSLLREVYGDDVGEDPLFLQHTYLTIVVKAIAARVLDLPIDDPADLLAGKALADEGILGAVEADFFDWPLKLAAGADLIRHVAQQTARFRLRDVEADVLKILYESLVDPDQRHDLGEYYTPDWLAGRVVAAVIGSPLTQRVLDPACGSGTFLFHAIRHLISAAQVAGWSGPKILEACEDKVRGLDVHPVAVTLARVTWLLALGSLVGDRPSKLTVPVFLGDAMQWNLRRYVVGADIIVEVPGEERPLQIPAGFAEDQAIFEQALNVLNRGLAENTKPEVVGRTLRRIAGAAPADAEAMAKTFGQLQDLYGRKKNGIWTFVFRNLVRPVWLSRKEQLANVLIGNPPWIGYRHMNPRMQERLREALRSYDLWVGGGLATQQDMWALFWARGAERYLGRGGQIAFVVPYAAMNAPVFAGVRSGRLGQTRIRITGGWSLEKVLPIFGAQSGSSTASTCVLFGRREMAGPPPEQADRWVGRLPRRDAHEAEAALALTYSRIPWPRARTLVAASPYRSRFHQGATVTPRRFFIVNPDTASRLGVRRDAPRMIGRVTNLDRVPWNAVDPPRGPVELQFIRRLCLGETILPFRLLNPVTAVIPLVGMEMLDAKTARERGYEHLSAWLRYIEGKWNALSKKNPKGVPNMALTERVNYMRTLSIQGGRPALRVVHAKAGTHLCAARIPANDILIDHKAYWGPMKSVAESAYLMAILNSDTVSARIADLQSHGEAGTRRDLDNLVWTLSIPEYDDTDPVHRDLAIAANHAEEVAAIVDLPDEQFFVTKRGKIRDALVADGIAAEIEALVDALLPP